MFTKIHFVEKVVELEYVILPALCCTLFSFFEDNKMNYISRLEHERKNMCFITFKNAAIVVIFRNPSDHSEHLVQLRLIPNDIEHVLVACNRLASWSVIQNSFALKQFLCPIVFFSF